MLVSIALAAALAPVGTDGVGVVWSEATVDPGTRQRVLTAVGAATGAGARLVDDADVAARRVVAYEVDLEVVERQRVRLEGLEAAETAYRAGDPAGARARTDTVLTDVRQDPQAPGLVALLVRAHLLRAQILWTEGDSEGADVELRAALVFDPEARVTTRRMPPDLVARHEVLRAELVAARAQWAPPNLTVGDEAAIELDGHAGARAVPPGEHVVVIRRPGAVPVGAFVSQSWSPPPPDERLPAGIPADAAHAERICVALELRTMLLVRTRDDRAGVQQYRCGVGFAAPWYGSAASLEDGVFTADTAALQRRGGVQALSEDAFWPAPPEPAVARPVDDPQPRPWWKRGWVWGLVGAVVVGGIVTGAVLGTRDPPGGYVVDSDSFLGR